MRRPSPNKRVIPAEANGYGAFSVSASQLEQVTSHILNQREHHKKMTFDEEFRELLKKAGVSHDPKHVFG
jgi:putative transposase